MYDVMFKGGAKNYDDFCLQGQERNDRTKERIEIFITPRDVLCECPLKKESNKLKKNDLSSSLPVV